MNSPTSTRTLPVYRGWLNYREVPVYLPGGTNRAATLVAPGLLGDGESLHWATADKAYLLPLSLDVGQVVMFAADHGSQHPRFFGVTLAVSDTTITLTPYDTARDAWDAAQAAGTEHGAAVPGRDELTRLRASLLVTLLDTAPDRAARALKTLLWNTDAMPPGVAGGILLRIQRALNDIDWPEQP
jgi:hypothetical protein